MRIKSTVGLFSCVLVAILFASSASAQGVSKVDGVIETSMGAFELELDAEQAPQTVANFLAYVDAGFYPGTQFHRVIPGFVVQGGGLDISLSRKKTREPVQNESHNGLKNDRGTVAMARQRDLHSATSQFFINVADNERLNHRPTRAGYTVFGRVTEGMAVIDRIAALPTMTDGEFRDVPEEAVVIVAAWRKAALGGEGGGENSAPEASAASPESSFIEGEHYTLLKSPVKNRRAGTIEVVEAFSYGCTRCYRMEPLVAAWRAQQPADVDFWQLHAVWNPAMKLYARAFYAARYLQVTESVHLRLFAAIVAEHRQLDDERSLAAFFAEHGADAKAFSAAFNSPAAGEEVAQAARRTRSYNLASVPEIVVNGKYRVDPMRAGGRVQMMQVVDYLVERERARLNQ